MVREARWAFCLGLLITAAVPGYASDIPCPFGIPSHHGERLSQPLVKGVELYSWRVNASHRYAVLVGTSQSKSVRDIKLRACTLPDLAALRMELSKLADGETVGWLKPAAGGFEYPPSETIEAVREHCRTLGVSLALRSGEGAPR
jgi:hypothetical protein